MVTPWRAPSSHDQVARRINALHRTPRRDRARLGEALLEAKAATPYGHWLRWIRENLDIRQQEATACMRAALAERAERRRRGEGAAW